MAALIAIVFETEAEAAEVLATLRTLERAGGVRFNDTALLEKDDEGKLRLKNEWSSGVETGTVVGELVGSVLPVLGTIVGAIAGGWLGSRLSPGVDGSFVDEVGRTLEPGHSALVMLIRESNPDAITAGLRAYKGRVFQTTLTTEQTDALNLALEKRL